jgi:phage I-like protein
MTGDQLPETRKTDIAEKGDEKASAPNVDDGVTELKRAEENRVLNEFFQKHGYSNLDEATRKEKYAQLALSLAEMVDPGGKRPIKEVLSSIPISKLPKFLENAHVIANKKELYEQGKREAMLSAEENANASIGSFPSSSGDRETGVRLSNRERDVARKMGVSEEEYAKMKGQIQADTERFS